MHSAAAKSAFSRLADWRDVETLDPGWHIFSERVPGTFADYVAVPRRNAIPLPAGLSALDASVLGTAWLTAYRTLFTKTSLEPGETLLVRNANPAERDVIWARQKKRAPHFAQYEEKAAPRRIPVVVLEVVK